jgi:hypothetical protein
MAVVGCNRDPIWFLDANYSHNLLGSAASYELRTGDDPADTVDAVEIYETSVKDSALLSIDEVRSFKWVFDTSNRDWIRSLFIEARSQSPESCVASQAPYVLHVLSFDRELMRVGYHKYYPCSARLGALAPFGTSSLYFSSSLPEVLSRVRE